MGQKPVRAFVLGASGLVGHYCLRQWRERPGWSVLGTSHKVRVPGLEPLDIRDGAALRALLRDARPDLTVLAASNPHVDYCERHPEATRAINVEATLDVARAVREQGSALAFFSSDYVFDGSGAPFGEDDPARPLNEYGRQKAEAERGVRALGPDHLICRLSGVFGWELGRKNFVLQVLDRGRRGEPVRAATDVRYNPTYAANLPDALAELFEAGRRGLYHAAGAEEMSRYDFALAVCEAFGLPASGVEAATAAALGSPTPRPANSSLRTDKIRSQIRAPLWGAIRALKHMREAGPAWKAYLEALPLPTISRR
ncbi:MAG: SDR family oxidoreductase [Elusimicrobia bacterium]|nr:SDR family oxidoreductase [Elusimicrobiota bacterium]